MGANKIDDHIEGRILQLLRLRWSHSLILKELKKDKIAISRGLISKIKNGIGKCRQTMVRPLKKKNPKTRVRSITKSMLKKLSTMVSKVNPPTQNHMAKKINVPRSTLRYHIKFTLAKKLVMKAKVHALSLGFSVI
jgi:hypothetical protein